LDFGFEAWEIFYQSPDDVKDVAEDITREMLDRLGGYQIQQRVLGNVDYRKARYIILPDSTIRQALFVDSKAEKESRTATMQMSQISMAVKQERGGKHADVPGKLPAVSVYGGQPYLTTTLLLHYCYEETDNKHLLQFVTLAAIPSGLLQETYNPSSEDTVWLAGRNAPSRGEEFRVRLSFASLNAKCPWRVQRVRYDPSRKHVAGEWVEERWAP
jgi:hypothetical protein